MPKYTVWYGYVDDRKQEMQIVAKNHRAACAAHPARSTQPNARYYVRTDADQFIHEFRDMPPGTQA